jgi:hypothetical protein
LTEYERVVLLDADNLALRNMDELFLCGEFCAVFLNPCIFHTGLVVLKPSLTVFQDMQEKLWKLYSFDAADQGFLTSYYPQLLDAPLFHPPRSSPLAPGAQLHQDQTPLQGLYRLPMGYQMDAIYYNLKFKWEIPCSENKVVTFPGLSALKPWYWWTWPILAMPLQWHQVRAASIGYAPEFKYALATTLLWCAILVFEWLVKLPAHSKLDSEAHPLIACKGEKAWWPWSPASQDAKGCFKAFCPPRGCMSLKGLLRILSIPAAGCVSYFLIPATAHPFVGWPLFFLGTIVLLHSARRLLGTSAAIFWTPAYVALSMAIIALPIYSGLPFKVVAMFVLTFFGGLVFWESCKALL